MGCICWEKSQCIYPRNMSLGLCRHMFKTLWRLLEWVGPSLDICLYEYFVPDRMPRGGGGGLQSVLMRPTPQLSVKTCKGGGGGRRQGGGGGVLAARPGGPKEGGGLCVTRYYHMHTSRGCVFLEALRHRGMYAIIAISHLCQEESLKGLKY